MNATGIIRRLDNLGRLVIAKEIVNSFGWKPRRGTAKGTAIEIYVKSEMVVLKEYDGRSKPKGIIRHFDSLGRLVIPREIINSKGWKLKDDYIDGTSLETFIDDGRILLKEYNPGCTFCGEMKDITIFKNKNVCEHCLKELAE